MGVVRGSTGGVSYDCREYLKEHWPAIREQLVSGTYKPQPVKRVEIPKPDGGVRKLGIPTVLDRFLQQAVAQVLQAQWDPTFSEHSYGFRPGRSAHQAVAQAQQYQAAGYTWVVDRVHHDRLMAQIAKRVEDKRVWKLLRGFLTAGVMENGLESPRVEGTPQGGPLSPLLSNLVLDELDRELEARGHHFVRYADDGNIYVRSERAGQRVMESVKRFLTKRLQLKVNEAKSAVARPQERKFLGFSFTGGKEQKRKIGPKAMDRCKGASTGTDATDPGDQHGAEDRGAGPLPARLARILRLLSDPLGAGSPELVDPKAAALRLLAAVENQP